MRKKNPLQKNKARKNKSGSRLLGQPDQTKSKSIPIVAIGASAGGLEAITELLKNLSSNTGFAYVYIQHLDPNHKSMLSKILSNSTKMKVNEARDGLAIEPDHLYVIPPNKEMFILDGILKLKPRPLKPKLSMPINRFFKSLAERQKDGAIGIVLSGNANDGAIGLKEIKNGGGLTFAQDDSAKFQSMPKSAIAEGAVDLVLSPDEMGRELVRLSSHTGTLHQMMVDPDQSVEKATGDFESIMQMIWKTTGMDFRNYKRPTIYRRIIRRMLINKLITLKDYHQYLKRHSDEIGNLYKDLLIHVTGFFRDTETINFLEKKIIPKILKGKTSREPLRVWIPACSTGEEVYSIAILFCEAIGQNGNYPIHIFATDLSEAAVAKARLGIYSKADVEGILLRRRQRFFTKIDGSYRVEKAIRDMCVFAQHNILSDLPSRGSTW